MQSNSARSYGTQYGSLALNNSFYCMNYEMKLPPCIMQEVIIMVMS